MEDGSETTYELDEENNTITINGNSQEYKTKYSQRSNLSLARALLKKREERDKALSSIGSIMGSLSFMSKNVTDSLQEDIEKMERKIDGRKNVACSIVKKINEGIEKQIKETLGNRDSKDNDINNEDPNGQDIN